MKIFTYLHKLLFVAIALVSFEGFSQCFQIETILVDACSMTTPTNDEGFNEMVRFRVGAAAINTSTLSVNWPAQTWTGLVQNAVTAAHVTQINAAILAAGNCGQVLQPTGGVLPANAEVLLITSQNFTPNYNLFTSLNSTLYIIFQDNTTTTGGHFGNYNATPGTRTLSMTFGGGCTDTVTYERSNLINVNGTSGGTLAEQDGATVNFTAAGVPSYVNTGCNAPVTPFTVSAAANPNTCVAPGAVVTLTGTASGHQSTGWTTNNGTVPNPNNLNTSYTVPANATGSISFTLTATNTCGATITSTVSISIAPPPPTVVPITYCQNAPSSPLTATGISGATFTWYNVPSGGSPIPTPTPPTNGTVGSTVPYYVTQTVGGCQSARINLDVTIGNTAPTTTPNLFCDAANTTTTQVAFDFNNAGQSSFTYSYTIDGGGLTTGNLVSPSHYNVPVTGQGQAVTFTLTWNGICTPSQTITCYSTCTTTPVLSIHNPPAACVGGSVNLTLPAVTAGSTGGGTLSYWNDLNATMPLGNPSAVSIAGTYYIKSALGGCFDIEPVVVTFTALPAAPTLSTTAPTCSANGFTTITNYVAAYTYTFSPTGPTAGAGGVISGTTVGTAYTVRATTSGSCVSPVSTPFTNQAQLPSPVAPTLNTTSPTCAANGSTTITNYNATNTYNFSPAGPTAGAGGTISGAVVGTAYTVTATNGGCTSVASVSFTNQAQLPTPVVPTLNTVPPTCAANGSTTITNYNAGYTYTFSPVGPTAGAGGTILGATSGTAYTVRATSTGCVSAVSAPFTNQAQLQTPVAPTLNTTPPTCTANGSTTITNYNAGYTYTFSPAGPTAGAGGAISGTVSGTAYTVRATSGGCISASSVSFTNQAQLPTPVVPALNTTPPTCTANGSTTITNYNAGYTYTFSPLGPTVGAGGAISGAVAGTAYTVRATSTGCVSAVSAPFTNQAQLPTPIVPTLSTTPPTCTVNGFTTITNYNAVNTYIFSPVGPTAGAGGTISGAVNGVAYTVRAANGACTSLASASFTNQGATIPAIPITNTTAPTCTANGSTTITNYNPAFTYNFSPVGPGIGTGGIITGAILGTSYTVTATSSSCTSASSSSFTNLPMLPSPNLPTPQPLQLCDPSNDGLVTFDLTTVTNFITGGNPNYTLTFHETPTDANVGGTSIPTPASYDNIVPWAQTVYIRVISTTSSCYQVIPLQLIVNPTPEATQPDDYVLCDTTAPTGFEVFDLTTRIPEILGTINPALTTVTFYHTLPDAQTPINAISNVTSYPNSTINSEILYVRVETTATGCYDIVTLNLVVSPLPSSLQPNYPQYSLCDNDQSPGDIGYEVFDLGGKVNDILLGQLGMDVTFYVSLGDAQNGTGQIMTSLYENQIQYVQTLGIRITNQITGCYVISTIDIRVEPLPTLTPPTQPYTLCDQNQDGYTTFDLTTLIPGLLSGITTYALSFHETIIDAQNNGTTIPNPSAYNNINAFVQIIYVRAEDINTHCVSITPIELNVNPSPIAPISLTNIIECDDDSNPQDAITAVDLTQRTADVLALQPAGSYTVTYYNTQLDAETPNGPIIPDTNYIGADNEIIWVRVENNVTGCYNVGSFILEINTPLLLITPAPLNVCDDDAIPNDQLYVFDLTIKNNEINQGLGYLVQYYPSLGDAQNNTNIITTPTAYLIQTPPVQTLGVVVTTADGCKSITTLDIRVLPIPTPRTNPPALAPKCDDNNPGDMLEVFDLTQNEAYIRNGDPNLTFHYYLTLADAQGPLNEIANPSAASVGGNVWIRVENNRVDYQGNHCYVLVEQALTVNPLPQVIQPLAPYRVCDNDADGLAQFDLTNPALAPLILGTATTNQQPADYTITYHATPGNAATGAAPLVSPYTNITPTSDTVYIRVVNNATGCVNASGVLPLAVEPYATATGPQSFTDCDNYGDPYDGVHQIDLTQFEAAILNGQNPAVFLVSYYRTQADADAGTSPLTAAEEVAYTTDPDTDTIWVKVENSSNTITPYCYALTTINITVERYPDPIINTPNGVHTICVDFLTGAVLRPLTLDSGIANTAGYTFEWFEAGAPTAVIGTDATYEVNTADAAGATRSYTVHVTSISALACDTTSAPFDVIQSGPAVIPAGTIGYTVSNAFSNTQIITVSVEGYGTYEYSLDDGPRQAGNVFEDVSFGTHTIHVWDTEGGIAYSCEQLIIEEVQIIDYPHYFTPNGDGVHDTWNIVGLGGQPGAKIYIFDRYGKLLKQISSTGEGWNGTYNGHLLPSDDYWFTVDFMEDAVIRQFKAHFTLKR